MSDFAKLLARIERDCAWENLSLGDARELGACCDADGVQILIQRLDSLKDEDLADDAGDGADHYGRLRTALSEALASAGEIAREPLLAALGSHNRNTVLAAARALGLMQAEGAFEAILALLQNSQAETDSMALITALGNLGDPRALPPLTDMLQVTNVINRGWFVRLSAIALGKIARASGDPHLIAEQVHSLSPILQQDANWFARLGAAEGLSELKSELARNSLQQALHDQDSRVVQTAREGLAALLKR